MTLAFSEWQKCEKKGVSKMKASKDFKIAQRLFVSGKITESIQAFTKAINSGDKSEIAFLSRGVAYLKNHNADKAIHDFGKVVKMNDKNLRAHYYRGIAYLTIDDFKDAIAEFSKTLELKPDYTPAFFARGTAYAQMGRDDEATKNIKSALMLSDADIYELQETIGLWRTQFDRTISLMAGEKRPLKMELSEKEAHTLRKWLEEGHKKERYH
jgi:tetratricopeptide (TPR) repeat protein